MINFKEVLESANKKYKLYLIHVARVTNVNQHVSGEVEAMGKAIVEAINVESEKPNPDIVAPKNEEIKEVG